jgi:4-diphosphocytidyl-2-C-methyl-D-erythritol kinase
VKLHAPAKINLWLDVGPVLANGRHPLASLVVFADEAASDLLQIEPADAVSLNIIGPFASGLLAEPVEANLVWRAAMALLERTGCRRGAGITLDKRLPLASGMGGGSADAAAALDGLNRYWSLGLNTSELMVIAADLGADVPACLIGEAGWMSGTGETFERLEGVCAFPAVLCNPGKPCPTGPVFAAFDQTRPDTLFLPHPPSGPMDLQQVKARANALEGPAMRLAPDIARVLSVLRRLPGARLARMTGSGATCFALCESLTQAREAASALAAAHPDWWSVATLLNAPKPEVLSR